MTIKIVSRQLTRNTWIEQRTLTLRMILCGLRVIEKSHTKKSEARDEPQSMSPVAPTVSTSDKLSPRKTNCIHVFLFHISRVLEL